MLHRDNLSLEKMGFIKGKMGVWKHQVNELCAIETHFYRLHSGIFERRIAAGGARKLTWEENISDALDAVKKDFDINHFRK